MDLGLSLARCHAASIVLARARLTTLQQVFRDRPLAGDWPELSLNA